MTSGVKSLTSSKYLSLRCDGTSFFAKWEGRVREVCRNVPPVRPTLFTRFSSRTWHDSCSSIFRLRSIRIKPSQPLRIPRTSYPSRKARNVMARMAGFNPGTSPPPVRIPMVPFLLGNAINSLKESISESISYLCTSNGPLLDDIKRLSSIYI